MSTNSNAIEFLFQSAGLAHDTGRGHPECAARLSAIAEVFERAGVSTSSRRISSAREADVARVHTREHIRAIKEYCKSGATYPDPDVVMGPGSWEAAMLAAGTAIAACKGVAAGEIRRAFCAVRPPGHHAEADRAMGFCLFNNVAVAARWLQAEAGVKRVAILDWDVHHGNGTQHSFYNDDTVLYVSLHQHPLYPGTGQAHERGKNNTNLNIPLPPGAGPEQWLEALGKKAVPVLEAFAPDFLLISCGFDAHRSDPLAHQRLETETFAEMTRAVVHLAGGRIVSLLEGGYHLEALGASALAHFKALEATP